MSPPLVARALLLVVAGDHEAEFVAGDLEEEFVQICEMRGRFEGSRWYISQVVRSAASLLRLRLRSGELTHVILAAALGAALPLMLLDRLWCFVYSQIPLKDGIGRAPVFLAANLLCLCFSAAIAGSTAPTAHRAVAIAAAGMASAAFATWAAVGATPPVYVLLVLLAAPASSLFAFAWRKSR